ncbi:MAG: hypothetical protein IM591_16375 [Chitinophagaceae bacterium]|uniref:hypothetical protein n=1 Tax=Microcystis sp. M061S2 TaxID=2771171 RepID=UPI00258834D8|nr:hypothetical protein [Microcystis sp. M061S2]MCA6423849.1 hypothetical protein [Flavobacterium sp.]MCA6471949.1 hypothetical protein [Chitinophagaceae bacterium]
MAALKMINAKFKSKCSETGKTIYKGDVCFYDYQYKQVFHPSADIVRIRQSQADEAQENAYFDNFCLQNNI